MVNPSSPAGTLPGPEQVPPMVGVEDALGGSLFQGLLLPRATFLGSMAWAYSALGEPHSDPVPSVTPVEMLTTLCEAKPTGAQLA